MNKSTSVILPFHRVDKYLDLAIKSVLDSRNMNVQLVLIDDRKIRVQDQFSNESSVWTGGVGYANALNIGKEFASEEYVALMNSDDLVSKDRLHLQVKSIENNECSVSVTRLLKMNLRGVPLFSLGGNAAIYHPKPIHFLFGSHLSNASWMTRNDFWQQNIEFPAMKVGSDWALGQRIIKNYKFQQLHRRLYFYRTHKMQITKVVDYESKGLSPIWQVLNKDLVGVSIPDSFGLILSFPGKFQLSKSDVTLESLAAYDAWISKVYRVLDESDFEIAKPRIAYLSYCLSRINPAATYYLPNLAELSKIYLKSRINAVASFSASNRNRAGG